MEVKRLNGLEMIRPYWSKLWPNIPAIGAVSIYSYYDGKNYWGDKVMWTDISPPTFYALWVPHYRIAAVNSYYVVDNTVRSRGLWVEPEFRGQGFGRILLEYAIQMNMDKGYKFIWSMPRKEALPVYEAVGFKQTSPFYKGSTPNGMTLEYENCYCRLDYD